MRILWNSTQNVFQAEFSADFQGDLDAAKAAGFRTFGAPEWIWYAPPPGIKALNRLKDNKPKSGLTITEAALEKYKTLSVKYEKKEEIKKALKDARKAAKKEECSLPWFDIPEKGYIDASDLPPMPPFVHTYVRPNYPHEFCFICGCEVPICSLYKTEPLAICLWCEKEMDEKKSENSA